MGAPRVPDLQEHRGDAVSEGRHGTSAHASPEVSAAELPGGGRCTSTGPWTFLVRGKLTGLAGRPVLVDVADATDCVLHLIPASGQAERSNEASSSNHPTKNQEAIRTSRDTPIRNRS